MFQFSGSPSIHYGFMHGCMRFAHAGFPIRTSPDQRLCAPTRSFSQLVTSFIGSQCQGIRPAPFMFDLFDGHPFHYSVSYLDFLMNCAISLPAKGRYDTRSDRSDLDFLETFLNCFNHASDVFLSSTLLRLDIILLESFVYSVFKVRPGLSHAVWLN